MFGGCKSLLLGVVFLTFGDYITFGGYKSLRLRNVFVKFVGCKSLRSGVAFFTFGVVNPYVRVLYFLRSGIVNGYILRL